jgi:hypothetical protein
MYQRENPTHTDLIQMTSLYEVLNDVPGRGIYEVDE